MRIETCRIIRTMKGMIRMRMVVVFQDKVYTFKDSKV